MKKSIFIVTLAVSIGLFPSLLLGAVWYVDMDNAGTQDGTGWMTAFTAIQAGIDAAFADGGGEVWVAEGSYPEAISISSNVMLYGGFASDETQLSERDIKNYQCIINASTANSGNPANNAVTMNSVINAGIDGFMITGGVAEGSSGSEGYGAGVYGYNLDATVAIRNCMVIGNTARNGGGIYTENSSVDIESCIISGNTALSWGGAMYLNYGSPKLVNCIVSGNSANLAGAGYFRETSGVIRNCTISGNTGSTICGGVAYGPGSIDIFNTIFCDNALSALISVAVPDPVLQNCLFHNNGQGDYYDYNGATSDIIYSGANELNLFLDELLNQHYHF